MAEDGNGVPMTKYVIGFMGRRLPTCEPLTKYKMGKFHFVYLMASAATGGFKESKNPISDIRRAAQVFLEYLTEEDISFGDDSYDWTPTAARELAEELMMRD